MKKLLLLALFAALVGVICWPGKKSRSQTTDVVAFILSTNKFPAGATDLLDDADSLKTIRIETQKKSPH